MNQHYRFSNRGVAFNALKNLFPGRYVADVDLCDGTISTAWRVANNPAVESIMDNGEAFVVDLIDHKAFVWYSENAPVILDTANSAGESAEEPAEEPRGCCECCDSDFDFEIVDSDEDEPIISRLTGEVLWDGYATTGVDLDVVVEFVRNRCAGDIPRLATSMALVKHTYREMSLAAAIRVAWAVAKLDCESYEEFAEALCESRMVAFEYGETVEKLSKAGFSHAEAVAMMNALTTSPLMGKTYDFV